MTLCKIALCDSCLKMNLEHTRSLFSGEVMIGMHFVCLSVCLSSRPSIHLSVRLSVRLSGCNISCPDDNLLMYWWITTLLGTHVVLIKKMYNDLEPQRSRSHETIKDQSSHVLVRTTYLCIQASMWDTAVLNELPCYCRNTLCDMSDFFNCHMTSN
mgnify:CR=1 FL=1